MNEEYINDDTEALLVSNLNSVEAEIIVSMLNSYDVPCFKKSRGVGSIMEIYTGAISYGIDIYVPSHMLEFALELINPQNIDDDVKNVLW